jgi:type VI secretion system protein ImpK
MVSEHDTRGSVSSLTDLAASVFSLILSLRTSANYGTLPELRARIGEYLDRIDREGLQAGIAREDLEAAKYPLVAFLDETILNSEWDGRMAWREHPLQLDLFGEGAAGDRFFERLDKVRGGGEAKADLLEIYWLCLALGFEGKYKILGPDKLRALVDDVGRELGLGRRGPGKRPLSPHGRHRETIRKSEGDRFPTLKVAIACVGGLLVLYLVLFFVMSWTGNGALHNLPDVPS